jgi:hypothetical protein
MGLCLQLLLALTSAVILGSESHGTHEKILPSQIWDYCLKVRVRVTLQLAVYHQSVHLGTKPFETHNQYFLFQLNTCGYGPYVTSSLTREWWSSPVQSFSGPSSMGLMTIFCYLKSKTPSTWRARALYLYPPQTGWPSYTTWQWVPFSSPTTTCRAML